MFKDTVIAVFDKILNERNWFIFFTFYLNHLSSLHKLVCIEFQFYKHFPYIFYMCISKNAINYIMTQEFVFR